MPDLKLHEGDRFPVERLPQPLERETLVFFYPAALTGGWTREARRFNELLPELDRLGVDVIGASVDTSEVNAQSAAREELAYGLVSDPARELADELGLLTDADPPVAARTSYLLAVDGTILRLWQVGGGEAIDVHPGEVLDAVRARRDAS